MKKIQFLFTSLVLVLILLPVVTFAQSIGLVDGGESAGKLGQTVTAIIGFINTFLLPLALAIGFLVFIWGVIKYFVMGGDNDEAKASGKSLIIYAVIGFVIILSFYGIVKILVDAIGAGGETTVTIPEVPKRSGLSSPTNTND